MTLNVLKSTVKLTLKRSLSLTRATLSILLMTYQAYGLAAESVTIQQVALSTDEVPGGGSTLGVLNAPSINGRGAIAFGDNFGTAIYTMADSSAVGQLRKAVGAGEVPPGILGRFGAVADYFLRDDGSFSFRGFGLDSSNRGVYVFVPPGKLQLIADASTTRPGTQDTFSPGGPSFPVSNNSGDTVFTDSTAFTQGVYRAKFDTRTKRTLLSELVTLENGFLQLPGFEVPLDYSINDSSGSVAMVLRRLDLTRGIYVAEPKKALRHVVAEGDPLPSDGSLSGGFQTPSINAAGNIAFTSRFNNNLGIGVFIVSRDGRIDKVIDNTSEVPNQPGTKFDGFGSIYLADDSRTIVFQGAYTVGETFFNGIFKKSGTKLEVIYDQSLGIVVNGQRVGLVVNRGRFFSETLPMFLSSRFVSIVDGSTKVAFSQQLPPQGFFPMNGIFVAVQTD